MGRGFLYIRSRFGDGPRCLTQVPLWSDHQSVTVGVEISLGITCR